MKLIKLDRRYHGFPKWLHALEFTKRECHLMNLKHITYKKAFREIYGEDRWFDPDPNLSYGYKTNENWAYDNRRRRIYFNDPSILTFIELKIA